MRFLRKNNIFIMISICLVLLVSINLTYSKFTYSKEVSGSLVTIKSAISLYDTLVSKSSTLDTNVNFKNGASSSNGQGLMMRNGTQTSTYPILYYRGNVSDNNVVYGGYCWLIVRTTETGGVKLIYNGSVNSDGSCNNYSGVGGATAVSCSEDSCGAYINGTTSVFFSSNNSPTFVGYMHNNIIYGTSSVCSKSTSLLGYETHLADNTVDGTTGRHNQNKYDSTIKGIIDTWYKSNIEGKTYESLLEDTVWCNDRSVTSTTYTIDNYFDYRSLKYSAYTRLNETSPVKPSLTCAREMDKFTVSRDNGNGDLDYSIGMLTADEMVMAGNTYTEFAGNIVTTYLTILNHYYWSMSPSSFSSSICASVFVVGSGELYYSGFYARGVRPSISLNQNATVTSGDGSFSKPFVIN